MQHAAVDQRLAPSAGLGDFSEMRRPVGIEAAAQRPRHWPRGRRTGSAAIGSSSGAQRMARTGRSRPQRSSGEEHVARRAQPARPPFPQRCDRVSSDWLKISAGNPVRTSAIGPWRSSAVLNASAWSCDVSLSLSAASCAMPHSRRRGRGRIDRSHLLVRRPAGTSRASTPRRGSTGAHRSVGAQAIIFAPFGNKLGRGPRATR